MIYLDNNATTQPLPEVVNVMAKHWRDSFANPGSRHAPGRRARQVLEAARESIASILRAEPDEVIFTSGGTESNNMAVLGFTAGTPGTIALTAGEHPAVLETCRFLEGKGWGLQFLPVDGEGLLAPLPPLQSGGQGGGVEWLVRIRWLVILSRQVGGEGRFTRRRDPPLLRGGVRQGQLN